MQLNIGRRCYSSRSMLRMGLLDASGGPPLFGSFSIADAFYALLGPPTVRPYMQRVRALPSLAAWIDAARAEKDFLDFEEPHRRRRA